MNSWCRAIAIVAVLALAAGACAWLANGTTVSYREFLASYWGARWPALEAQICGDREAILAQRVRAAEIPPWTELEPIARSKLRGELQAQRSTWGKRFERENGRDPHGSYLNPEGKALAEEQLRYIAAIFERHAREIEAAEQRSFDLTVEADEATWDQGEVRAFPLIEFPTDEPKPGTGELVFVRKWGRSPWTASYTIDSAEWPELQATLVHLATLRAARDREIRDYIRGL